MKDITKDVAGDTLRRLMSERQLSVVELAARSGVSKKVIYLLLGGKSWNLENINRVLGALDVNLGSFYMECTQTSGFSAEGQPWRQLLGPLYMSGGDGFDVMVEELIKAAERRGSNRNDGRSSRDASTSPPKGFAEIEGRKEALALLDDLGQRIRKALGAEVPGKTQSS